MVNLSLHTLCGEAECCKHRLCLTYLFGRWVVNGVGYVFYSVSADTFPCLHAPTALLVCVYI